MVSHSRHTRESAPYHACRVLSSSSASRVLPGFRSLIRSRTKERMAWVSAGEEAASKVRPVSSSSTCSHFSLGQPVRSCFSYHPSTAGMCRKKGGRGSGRYILPSFSSSFAASSGELVNKYSWMALLGGRSNKSLIVLTILSVLHEFLCLFFFFTNSHLR